MHIAIHRDDKTGRFQVGEFTPPKATMVAPNRPAVSPRSNQPSMPAMQEARDLNEALDIVRNLFGGSQEEAADASFGRGYRKAAPLPFTDATQVPDVQGKKY